MKIKTYFVHIRTILSETTKISASYSGLVIKYFISSRMVLRFWFVRAMSALIIATYWSLGANNLYIVKSGDKLMILTRLSKSFHYKRFLYLVSFVFYISLERTELVIALTLVLTLERTMNCITDLILLLGIRLKT